MRVMSRFLLLSAVVLAAACRGDDSDVTISSADSVRLGEGDIRITSTDGGIDLMLLGDRIAAGLSDSVLAAVREETDTSALESGSGIGASVERFVKSTVQNTLAKRVDYPVSDLRDVRYEDGRIVFEYEGDARFSLLENAETKNRPVLASFSEEDSKRFVDAVKKRIP